MLYRFPFFITFKKNLHDKCSKIRLIKASPQKLLKIHNTLTQVLCYDNDDDDDDDSINCDGIICSGGGGNNNNNKYLLLI
jgi:hypothetical protein